MRESNIPSDIELDLVNYHPPQNNDFQRRKGSMGCMFPFLFGVMTVGASAFRGITYATGLEPSFTYIDALTLTFPTAGAAWTTPDFMSNTTKDKKADRIKASSISGAIWAGLSVASFGVGYLLGYLSRNGG